MDSCNFNGRWEPKQATMPCLALGCELSSWSAWGECSQDCGMGVAIRSRHIETAAENGGHSLKTLEEIERCSDFQLISR